MKAIVLLVIRLWIERCWTHTNDSETNHEIILFPMRMHITSVHPIRRFSSIIQFMNHMVRAASKMNHADHENLSIALEVLSVL
jgi:hypothetical protein